MQSFRNLKVWIRAVDLTLIVYNITAAFPKSETYGLSSQMRRAAVSIASNLAEGSARNTKKDFRQFVAIARGSNCELQTQLLIARRLEYPTVDRLKEAEALSHEICQMLTGLSKYLKKSVQGPDSPTDNEQLRTEH